MESIFAYSASRYIMADMDHYLYLRRMKTSHQFMYLKCRETTCHGSVNWHIFENRMYQMQPHNHSPVEEDYQKLLFRQSLRYRASVESIPFRDIFMQEKQKYPVGAFHTNFKKESSTMYRARQAETPPIPFSLQQFNNMISHERWFCRYGNELGPNNHIFYRTMLDTPLNPIIIFVSENIRRYAATLEDYRIHLDATFKVVTKRGIGTQLFIIHLHAFETVFPLLIAFMQSKSEEGYLNIIQYLQKILRKEPSVVLTDYEENLRNVVVKVFPNSRILVCSIHYARAVFKKSHQLELQKNDKQKKLVKYSMMLPLLPHNYLQEGLSYLEKEGISELFLDFLRQQWQGQNIPAYETDQRVNNSVASFTRSLIFRKGQPIPNIWALLDIFRFVEQKKSIDLENLIAGKVVSKSKTPCCLRWNRQVEECMQALTLNNDVPQFLKSLKNLADRLAKLFGPTEDLASLSSIDTNIARINDFETALTVNADTGEIRARRNPIKFFSSNSETRFEPTSITATTNSRKDYFDGFESATRPFETSYFEDHSSCDEEQQVQSSDVFSAQGLNKLESCSCENQPNTGNTKNNPIDPEQVLPHQMDSISVTIDVQRNNFKKTKEQIPIEKGSMSKNHNESAGENLNTSIHQIPAKTKNTDIDLIPSLGLHVSKPDHSISKQQKGHCGVSTKNQLNFNEPSDNDNIDSNENSLSRKMSNSENKNMSLSAVSQLNDAKDKTFAEKEAVPTIDMCNGNVDDRTCVGNNLQESNSDEEYESMIRQFYDNVEEIQNKYVNVSIQPFKRRKTSAEASEIVTEIDKELVKLIILKHSLSTDQISETNSLYSKQKK